MIYRRLMSELRSQAPRWLFALVIALQVCVGLLVSGIYLSAHNTLHNNGNWISTKTTLARGLMGAEAFVFDLQALARGRLALSAWHGHQEVVSVREFDPASVEFDYRLREGAYLTFEINRTKRSYTGIRMSAAELFPPAILEVREGGEFLSKKSFRRPRWTKPQRWHTLRVDFEDEGSFTVSVNNRRIESFPLKTVRPQRIGFRGGREGSFVKDVRVVSRDGTEFYESFRRPGNWRSVNALAVAGTLLLSSCLYLLLRLVRKVSPRILLFYFLMFSAVLIVVGLFASGIAWHRKEFYPDANEKRLMVEAAHVESGSERMISRIEGSYPRQPEPGVRRILFVGSSQTYGAGAAEPKHTLVRRTERQLNEGSAGAWRFECLNVAVEGYRIADMRRDLEERWIHWKPDVVIVNAGNNDAKTNSESWEREVMAIVAASKRAGAEVVLVPEANSVERLSQGLDRLHDVTKKLARREKIPLVEMREHLSRRADDGFLWWDWVHLSSFGQTVFADHLVAELVRLGVVDLGSVGETR